MKRTHLLNLAAIAFGIVVSLLIAEFFLRVQNFIQLDNFSSQSPGDNVFHHGTNELIITEYGSNHDDKSINILLLGDSWMEDKSLSATIGQELSKKSGKRVQVVNGGTSSYSPTLYLLKARKAYKLYGKFDYIIVNIDETDIGDEWLRCRIPTVRDKSGQIVAVPYENDIQSQYIWNGKLWAENSNSYVIRLIKFTFFYKILIPSLYKLTVSPNQYSNLMRYVFAPDAISLYKKEHRYFESSLLEMTTTISDFTSDSSNVYITHHPHLRGLVDSIDDGKLYLPVVSEAIKRLGSRTGSIILDARKHIRLIHGEALLKNTFAEGDPFSHLNNDGAYRYGKWIVSHMVLK